MSKKVTVKVFKGPHFEKVEKMAYSYLHKTLSEEAMKKSQEEVVRNSIVSSEKS